MRFSGNKYKYSSAEVGKLKMVQFSLMDGKEIESYGKEIKSGLDQDVIRALTDPKLGNNGSNEPCGTCKQTLECPGHFGYIKLV